MNNKQRILSLTLDLMTEIECCEDEEFYKSIALALMGLDVDMLSDIADKHNLDINI